MKKRVLFCFLLACLSVYGFSYAQQQTPSPEVQQMIERTSSPGITQAHLFIDPTKIQVGAVQFDENSKQIDLQGSFTVTNESDKETPQLYYSIYTGLQNANNLLVHPDYSTARFGPITLKPEESRKIPFNITTPNRMQFGTMGMEILFEYESGAPVIRGTKNIKQELVQSTEPLFSTKEPLIVSGKIQVNEKLIGLNNGPTLYPGEDTAHLAITIPSTKRALFISPRVSIFKKTFFSEPILSYPGSTLISSTADTLEQTISLEQPTDPGLYVFRVDFKTRRGQDYIPSIYGRFLVGGAIASITYVEAELDPNNPNQVKGITVSGTGMPPDLEGRDRNTGVVTQVQTKIYGDDEELLEEIQKNGVSLSQTFHTTLPLSKPVNKDIITSIETTISFSDEILSTHKYVAKKQRPLTEQDSPQTTEKPLQKNGALYIAFVAALLIIFAIYFFFRKMRSSTFILLLIVGGIFSAAPEDVQAIALEDEVAFYLYDADGEGDDDILQWANFLDANGVTISMSSPSSSICYAPGQIVPLDVQVTFAMCGNVPVPPQGDEDGEEVFTMSVYGGQGWWTNILFGFVHIDVLRTMLQSAIPGNVDCCGNAGDNRAWVSVVSQFDEIRYLFAGILDIDISLDNALGGSGRLVGSITMPEIPGTYPLFLEIQGNHKNGRSHWVGVKEINVCGTRDACAYMPGKQTLDSSGVLRDEDGTILDGYTVQLYDFRTPQDIGTSHPSGIDGLGRNFELITVCNYCPNKIVTTDFATDFQNKVINAATPLDMDQGLFEMFFDHGVSSGITGYPTRYDATTNTLIAREETIGEPSDTTSPGLKEITAYSRSIVHNVNGELTTLVFEDVEWPFERPAFLNPFTFPGLLTRLEGTIMSDDVFTPHRWWIEADDRPWKAYTLDDMADDFTNDSYLFKENTYGTDGVTHMECASYEDMCSNMSGIQFAMIDKNASPISIRLYERESDGSHTFIREAPLAGATYSSLCQGDPTTRSCANIANYTYDPDSRSVYDENDNLLSDYQVIIQTENCYKTCPGSAYVYDPITNLVYDASNNEIMEDFVYSSTMNSCLDKPTDVCSNIPGVQNAIEGSSPAEAQTGNGGERYYMNLDGTCSGRCIDGGTPIPDNAVICLGDEQGLPGINNILFEFAPSCTSARKCEYTCDNSHTRGEKACQNGLEHEWTCTQSPDTSPRITCNWDGWANTSEAWDGDTGFRVYCHPDTQTVSGISDYVFNGSGTTSPVGNRHLDTPSNSYEIFAPNSMDANMQWHVSANNIFSQFEIEGGVLKSISLQNRLSHPTLASVPSGIACSINDSANGTTGTWVGNSRDSQLNFVCQDGLLVEIIEGASSGSTGGDLGDPVSIFVAGGFGMATSAYGSANPAVGLVQFACPEGHVLVGASNEGNYFRKVGHGSMLCAPVTATGLGDPVSIFVAGGFGMATSVYGSANPAVGLVQFACPEGHVLVGASNEGNYFRKVGHGSMLCAPVTATGLGDPVSIFVAGGFGMATSVYGSANPAVGLVQFACPEGHVLVGASNEGNYFRKVGHGSMLCAPLNFGNNPGDTERTPIWRLIPTGEICEGTCTGGVPENSTLCPLDNEGVLVNTPITVVDVCSEPEGSTPKCEYTCNPGFELVGGICQPIGFSCTGTLPTNSIACPDAAIGLTVDTPYSYIDTCVSGSACRYTCAPGYVHNGVECVPTSGACLNEPDNAIVCPGDFLGVLVDTPSTVVDTCSAPEGSDPKCEYTCAPGFHNDGGVCVPDACVPDAMCTIPGLTVGGEACNVCCTDSEAIDWVNPATSLTEKICCKATPNHVACGVNPRTNDRGQSCGSVGAECSGECLCTDNACIDDPDGEPAEVHSVCCAAADQEFNPITNQDECPCDSCPGSSVVHIKDPVSGICYEQGPLLVEFNDQVLDGILHENMNFTLSDGIQKKCCQYGRVPGTNQCYCDPAQTQEPQLNGTTGEYDCPCCDGNQSGGDYYFLAPNGQCRLDGEPTGDVCSSGSCPVGTRNVGGVCCDLTNIVLDDDGNEVCESCDTRPDDPTCRGGTTPITGNYGICTSGQQIATTITCDDGTNNCVGVEIIDPDGGTRVFYEGSETTVTGSFNISFTDPTNAEFSILPRLGATINFRLIDAASNITNYYIYNGTNDTVAPTIPADGDVWFRINGADTTSGGDKKRGEYIEWTRTAVVAHAECLDSQNPGIDSIFCGCAAINDDMTTTHSLGYVDTFGNTITPHPLDTTNVLYSRLHEDNSGPGETFEFPIVDTAGNDGGVAQYTVDFIDRDAPDLSGSFSTDGGSTWNANLRDIRATDFESGDVQFRVTATDSQSLLWGEQMDIRGFTTSQGTAEGFYDDLCNQSVSVSELEGYRQRYGALPGGGNEGDASESRSISLNSVSPDATFFYVYACTQDNAGNIMARRFTFGTGGLGILGTADDMKGFSYSGASSRPSTECITRHWNALAQVERDAIPAEDEEAQQELFCYYRRILSAVEDEQPNLNQAFGESNNQRIRELNQAISQNIGSLTRGFEGFGSPYIYTHLDNLSEEEYTVPRKELIYYRLPPGVAEIEGNTGQIISLDRNAGVSTTTLDSFRVTGQKTIIIEGGNLHIKTDMAYGGRDDMVVFVVKRDPEGHGGNVYVDKDVTNIVGLFFIDGAFMNVEGSVPNLTVLNAAQHEEKLRKQLLIYGMVSSKNTRGGSFSTNESSELINAERLIASDGIGSLGHCPFGTDYEFGATVNSGEYYNCPITYATAIDFEVFRTLGLMEVTQDTIDFLQTTNCTQIGKRVPITMVGGESRELLYAWSGKRRCYQSEDTLFNLRATDKKFRTYIEFDSRGIREDFDILDR